MFIISMIHDRLSVVYCKVAGVFFYSSYPMVNSALPRLLCQLSAYTADTLRGDAQIRSDVLLRYP